jgi:hypothetical protein
MCRELWDLALSDGRQLCCRYRNPRRNCSNRPCVPVSAVYSGHCTNYPTRVQEARTFCTNYARPGSKDVLYQLPVRASRKKGRFVPTTRVQEARTFYDSAFCTLVARSSKFFWDVVQKDVENSIFLSRRKRFVLLTIKKNVQRCGSGLGECLFPLYPDLERISWE